MIRNLLNKKLINTFLHKNTLFKTHVISSYKQRKLSSSCPLSGKFVATNAIVLTLFFLVIFFDNAF